MESLRKSSSSPTSIPSDEEHDREGLVLLKEPGRKSDVKETISMLETRGKKLCSDLMSLQMDRAELTREVEVLSQHLMEKKQAGSLGKSTACMHRCYRQFPGCVNENYNHLFSAAEVGLGPDWSKIFTWPDVHSFGMVSTGLENEIFGNCERLRCKSCCLRRMCNREDMKFFRCSKLKRGRARNCSLPKISSCRSCKLNRCKGDILFPTELEELSPFSNCNCTCNICATENLNTRSSSSISCELEADSSSEFPVLENASNTMENWNSLEIHEVCKVNRSSETLNPLKSQNYDPKESSTNSSCPSASLCSKEPAKNYISSNNNETFSEPVATVETLQQTDTTKNETISEMIDDIKRELNETRKCLADIISKLQSHEVDPLATMNLSSREPISLLRGGSRTRNILVGLLLLLSFVLLVWFDIYRYISLDHALVLGYLSHWTRHVLQFQIPLLYTRARLR